MFNEPNHDYPDCYAPTRRNALKIATGTLIGSKIAVSPVMAQSKTLTNWVFSAGGLNTSPIVSDESIIVGTYNGTRYESEGYLYAIDRATGKQKWKYGPIGGIRSAGRANDGTVFVGSKDEMLHGIDLETGDKQWTFEVDGPITASPLIANGTVFTGSDFGGNKFYAIDTETGEKQWDFEGKTHEFLEYAPIQADGTVFVVLGSTLYALDANSGSEKWSFTKTYYIDGSPAVNDGKVFIGTHNGKNRILYALNTESGEEEWTLELSTGSIRTLAISDNTIVFSGGVELYAVDTETGEQKWSRVKDGDPQTEEEMKIVDGNIYLTHNPADKIYAVNLKNGETVMTVQSESSFRGAPAITDNTIYIGNEQDSVLSIDRSQIESGTTANLSVTNKEVERNNSKSIDNTSTNITDSEQTNTDSNEGMSSGITIGGGIAALGVTGYVFKRLLNDDSE
jgi:outer membrane protein assembly factor BamB